MASLAHIYINDYSNLENIDWNFPDNKQDEISQIHPYPARFIESLPRTLIQVLGCPSNCAILDPFCGSGTTLLEAQRAGIPSVGIDLNPIAGLISRVKTQPLKENFLNCSKEIAINARKKMDNGVKIPHIPNLNHWFPKDIQQAIESIILSIGSVLDMPTKDALQFCLSSIIVRVSNQDSDTRYAAIKKAYCVNDVFNGFLNACERLDKAKRAVSFSTNAKIITQDVLKVSSNDIGKKIGLVITSPPYPNAYEYWLYHKYRMWWLGYDPINVRSYEIGARPHYQKKNGQTEIDFASQMNSVFELFDHCVVAGGIVCVIIGRSIIKGRYIDNAKIITDLALNRKYSLAANIEREIPSSRKSFNLSYGKINKENILIFRKDL